jgi:hypothetical protein
VNEGLSDEPASDRTTEINDEQTRTTQKGDRGRAAVGDSRRTGVVGLTAATANAMPISTLKSECQSANSGRWVTDYSGGRVSGYYCYYSSISGNGYVDYYDRYGNYRWSG